MAKTLSKQSSKAPKKASMGTKKSKKRIESYSMCMHRVLQQIHPETGTSKMCIMNSSSSNTKSKRMTTIVYNMNDDTDPSMVTSVIVPSHVTSIGGSAFEEYTSLKFITFPTTVTSLGDEVFAGCTSLRFLTLPPHLISLGHHVFHGCTSLMSITLPTTVKKLGDDVFGECTSLISITFPYNLPTIGEGTFSECTSLTSINLPANLISLDDEVFQGCRSLVSISLPATVETIGDDVFNGCTSLTSITLPPNLTTLGGRVFARCTFLKSITIPPTVTTLGDDIFAGCKSITSVNLLSSPDYHQYSNPDRLFAAAVECITPQNMAIWARAHNEYGRSQLMTAAAISLKWECIERIFDANSPAIYEIDAVTGLSVAMLAAVGPNSDIESVYRMCKEYPPALMPSYFATR